MKINLGVLWNDTMKNFQVNHGQYDPIIFPETFSFRSSKYLIDLSLGDNRITVTSPGIYPQIYHRNSCLGVLVCKGV